MLNGEPSPGSDPQTGPVNIQTLKCLTLAPTVSHNHHLFEHHLNIGVCDNSNRSKCGSSRLVLFDASTERQLQQIPNAISFAGQSGNLVIAGYDVWLTLLVPVYQHLPEYLLMHCFRTRLAMLHVWRSDSRTLVTLSCYFPRSRKYGDQEGSSRL